MRRVQLSLLAISVLLASPACEVQPPPPPPPPAQVGFSFAGFVNAPQFEIFLGPGVLPTFFSTFAILEGAADLAPDDPTLGRYEIRGGQLVSNLPRNLVRLTGDGFLTVIDDRPSPQGGVYDAIQLELFPFEGFRLLVTLVDEQGTALDSTLPPCRFALEDFEPGPEVELSTSTTSQPGVLEAAASGATITNLRCAQQSAR